MSNEELTIQDNEKGVKPVYVNKNKNMAVRPATLDRFRLLKVHKRETDNDLLERLLDKHYPLVVPDVIVED